MAMDEHPAQEHSYEDNKQTNEEDDDAILAELEEEDDSSYRAQRFKEIEGDLASLKPANTLAAQEAIYSTLKNDDEVLRFTTEHERALVHFFHTDFTRCNTMDSHCEQIARKHSEYGDADVAFGRVNVKEASFVVEKLNIRVLPCVIGFVKGVVKGRVTGFEGICWDGKEGSTTVTRALEEALVDWTIVRKRYFFGHDDDQDDSDEETSRPRQSTSRRGIQGRKQQITDDDDDWD